MEREGLVDQVRSGLCNDGGFNTLHSDGHVKFYRAGTTKPWMWTIEADGPP
jgi:prepilin-type processing-associated H-X9-DG protein